MIYNPNSTGIFLASLQTHLQRADVKNGEMFSMRNMGADADYVHVYGIKLLAGRNFTFSDYNPDYNKLHNVVINENAVKLLGYTSNEAAIGKSITMFGKQWDIIGVIHDFHQKSLRYAMEPLILQPFYNTNSPFSIRVNTGDLPATMARIKDQYAAYFPGNLFQYYFLNESFNHQYANDALFGNAFAIFAGFAVCIACLGLFGLSLFSATQRTKEIGIRKVLGASVGGIVVLLSKDFMKLVLLSFVIASPVAWYIMQNWLTGFAYRIHISGWIFAGAGVAAVLIALATISFQAIKAAVANPVKSFRME